MSPDALFTPAELADRIRVHVRTLQRWRFTGEGPKFCKLGRGVRYRAADVEAWLKKAAS